MPIQIKAPNGEIAEFPDGTPDDVIVKVMRETYGGPEQSQEAPAPVDAATAERDKYYSSGIYAGAYNPLGTIAKTVDAFASGAQRAPLMGWDDEVVGGLRSMGGNTDYTTAQAQESAKKQAMRQQNPVASTMGELAGGLATGGTIASTGATLAGRNIPVIGRTGGAALEGMGYGALTGAGEADPGSRGTGALVGGALGAATGGIVSKAGDILASRAARKAAAATTQSADDLHAASQALYKQAYQAGVEIKPQDSERMLLNMRFAAGNLNEKLRPSTSGIVDDLANDLGKPMSLERFHELRQEVSLAMNGANDADQVRLSRMRDIMNGFADNVQQTALNGPRGAVDTFRQADDLWRRRSKTQKIEDLFDLADVKSARYSQSGMSNAVRDKASQLYTRIVKGQEKGFNAEETALIRQLSKGELTPKVVNWLGKFAPRGVVSASGGSALGAFLGSFFGPAGTIIGAGTPAAIGFGAANLADRAAVRGLQALGTAASSGNAPVLKAITNKSVPLIGGLSGTVSSQALRAR